MRRVVTKTKTGMDTVGQVREVEVDTSQLTTDMIFDNSRFDQELGVSSVEVLVAIINRATLQVSLRSVFIPRNSLLTGRRGDTLRPIRFSTLMNLITSWAENVAGARLAYDYVSFIGIVPRSD